MNTQLPPIGALHRRLQSLAALDLILSPEWEYRYFSFNSQWCAGQHMGSMRNGSGDEFFCLFHQRGWAGLKGLAHESEAWRRDGADLSSALRQAVPKELSEFSGEPAFRWDATTFAFYAMTEAERWVRLNDLTSFAAHETGEDELLALLVSPPAGYVRYASDYFEVDVALDLVESVFEHAPIDDALVNRLNPEIDPASIRDQLFLEIGYPKENA